MNPHEAYLATVQSISRQPRELKLIYQCGWEEKQQASAMLVLVGGWVFDFGDWPALGLVMSMGKHILGHTIPGSAFPKSQGLPKLFEASQCALDVGNQVQIVQDYSTNGTVVVPAEVARSNADLRLNDAVRSQWDKPCPKPVHSSDVILTQYAELALVRL